MNCADLCYQCTSARAITQTKWDVKRLLDDSSLIDKHPIISPLHKSFARNSTSSPSSSLISVFTTNYLTSAPLTSTVSSSSTVLSNSSTLTPLIKSPSQLPRLATSSISVPLTRRLLKIPRVTRRPCPAHIH